jgi:hypothetical protein
MIEKLIEERKMRRNECSLELMRLDREISVLERASRVLNGEPEKATNKQEAAGSRRGGSLRGLQFKIDATIMDWPDDEPITQRSIRNKIANDFPDAKRLSLTASISLYLKRLCEQKVLEYTLKPEFLSGQARPAYHYRRTQNAGNGCKL